MRDCREIADEFDLEAVIPQDQPELTNEPSDSLGSFAANFCAGQFFSKMRDLLSIEVRQSRVQPGDGGRRMLLRYA